ncbi:MAG: hypothetical protein HC822_26520 [Oscillochloris sp.]|nr:hypothetical protein [Oscillochloris sp.]
MNADDVINQKTSERALCEKPWPLLRRKLQRRWPHGDGKHGRIGEDAGGDMRREAEQLRAGYNLPPLGMSVTRYTGTMPLYLMPSVAEFDYCRRDLPPTVAYVGPCLWQRPSDEPAPAWIAELPKDRRWCMFPRAPCTPRMPFCSVPPPRAWLIAT